MSERVCLEFLGLKVGRVRIVLDTVLEKDWFVELEARRSCEAVSSKSSAVLSESMIN